jgi:hypothetical protein
MTFCEWLQHQHATDELILLNILLRDEACFTCEGVFNTHNSHIWAWDNPNATCDHAYQVRFSASVQAGIVGDIIMDPLFVI